MPETLATVRTEVMAGGLTRLGATVIDRLINDAYSWLIKKHLWPFREHTQTGAAPLTITDMGAVISVKDTANGNHRLSYLDRRTVEERYGDLTTPGTPHLWYIEGGTVLKTYPVGGTLSVRYYRNGAILTGSDPLIIPDAWVQLVIDRARYRGLLRLGDWAGASAMKIEIAEGLQDMIVDQMSQQVSDPDTVVLYDDGGY